MPVIKYDNILGGMNSDAPLHVLKPEEWTDLKNARTWVRSIDKVGGYVSEFNYTLGITQPNMVQFWQSLNSSGTAQGYFVYAKAGNIRRISPAGDTDIRQGATNYVNVLNPGTPTIADGAEWNFTAMSGGYNMVVSNPYIIPQYMNGDGTQLANLPNWGTEGLVANVAASTCQVIRAFKNQLIAGNIIYRTTGGQLISRPSTVLISSKAIPGAIPQTWLSSTNNAADNFELTSTDPILDIIVLRDYALVLCQNSMFLVGESTATTATPVKQLNNVRGILGKGCVQVVDGKAYIVTTDDIIVIDGSSTNFKSIANDIVKTNFFENELAVNGGGLVFMRYQRYFNEIMIAYPSSSGAGTTCDRALIYSLDDGSWSWSELPQVFDMTLGPVVGANDTLRPWTQNTYNYNVQRLHMAVGNQLSALDIGNSRGGAYEFAIEKFIDLRELQAASPEIVKEINNIYPVLVGGGQATIQMKFFNTSVARPIDWTSPDIAMNFDMDGATPDYKVDPSLRGRYVAMRITTNNTNATQLCNFSLDVIPSGKFG